MPSPWPDRVTSHLIRTPLLDVGDDDDADTGTDTTVPDDDNEDRLKPVTVPRAPLLGCLLSYVLAHPGARSPLRRPWRMFLHYL